MVSGEKKFQIKRERNMRLTGAMNPRRLLPIYLGLKCLQFGNLFFFPT